MANTAVESGPRLIAFVLPSIPESVPMARLHVRVALGFHGLGEYANDVETITSELVANAVRHVCDDGTETIGIALARTWNRQR
jgi:anti-sigma regulatory factor (Ser/Thr protein kinase)